MELDDRRFDQDQFDAWLAKRPGSSYSRFAAARGAAALRKGRSHPTLGPNLNFDGDWWDAGKATFETLLRLNPVDETARICEYGCGSLRVGAHFIRRQAPGRYLGLDVTEDYIAYGRQLIGPELLEEKRPGLGAISKMMDRAEKFQADMLFATHVAIHVHPDEKPIFFENIKKIAHKPGSSIVFDALIVREGIRFRNSGWGWPMDFYLRGMEPLRLVHIAFSRIREGVGEQFFLVFQR